MNDEPSHSVVVVVAWNNKLIRFPHDASVGGVQLLPHGQT